MVSESPMRQIVRIQSLWIAPLPASWRLLNRLNHILNQLLGIAEHHHGFVHVKEFVVQTGIAALLLKI